MPTTICTAFKRNCQPCGSRVNHETGLCGIHRQLVANPVLRARFDHDQAIYREAWERIQAGTHRLVGNHLRPIDAEPVALPPPRGPCGHVMKNGHPCTRTAGEHGKCGMHHSLDVRHDEDVPMKAAIRVAKRMWRDRQTVVAIDNYVTVVSAGLVERCRRELRHVVNRMVLAPFYDRIHFLVHNGATLEQLDAHVDGWVADGALTERRGVDVAMFAQGVIRAQQWRLAHPPAQVWRPDQREAQLAHDGQNVHTPEITKQMKDSLDILLAVEVPVTQVNSVQEILDSWRTQGRPEQEIAVVYTDLVTWWNRTMVYKAGDKLYKKCLRGLWCTIKSYKGETRAELEKRLWDECRDAAIPYSVCTQGHMARLSNVMVGFDEAFVPPIPVGEILQQKMAAISAMDIEYDKQIEMAEEVLAELNIPREEHGNWLAAF